MIRAAIFVLTVSLTQATLLLAYPLTARSFLLAGSLYLAGSLLALYLVLHPRSGWLVDHRSQVACNGRACVALTFDDGPDPVTTPRVLDVLREKQVRATFFVVGKRAARHPELVRRALAEGHLVENHTWSHSKLFCFLTPGRLRAEIEKCAETLAAIATASATSGPRWDCGMRCCVRTCGGRAWSTSPGKLKAVIHST